MTQAPPQTSALTDWLTCNFASDHTVREPPSAMGPKEFTSAITHEDPWCVARCLDVEVARLLDLIVSPKVHKVRLREPLE